MVGRYDAFVVAAVGKGSKVGAATLAVRSVCHDGFF